MIAHNNLIQRLVALDAVLSSSPLRLEGSGVGSPGGWFLGPKAENKGLLLDLIARAIEEHCQYRTSYHPEDPEIITRQVKQSPEYIQAVEALRRSATDLNEQLKRSAPIFSMRSHGHMLWDQVLPGMIGYFAGMLYNQNNVAAEASPITTWLEIQVGNDLCRMLGYAGATDCSPTPWGHITSCGSVANIEALWAARNAKFFALAVRHALKEVPFLRPAAPSVEAALPDGTHARLIELDTWTLLNLTIDEVVALPHRIADILGGADKLDEIARALRPFTVQNVGFVEFHRRYLEKFPVSPVVFVPSTAHYSWPKAGALLGLGQNNITRVHVDYRARMHVPDLVDKLHECLRKRVPVIAVVAVIGSTEESAVDPLDKILEERANFRKQGLDFSLHCDAAWGGYFASMYRATAESATLTDTVPEYPMSDYVDRQYSALAKADSITVDPHKAGFLPYPAGGLCYRNSAMRDLISLKAPVVFHSQSEPTVDIYGIEGSKPGAAATGVYLAHKVIRPDQRGYGKILGECVWTSKRMYCRLLTMQDRDLCQPSPFRIELFQMLPAEHKGLGEDAVRRERDMVASFVSLSNDELRAKLSEDAAAKQLFDDLGSDQVILAYAFNFRDQMTGRWNADPARCNKLNQTIYEICSIVDASKDPKQVDLILTGSAFDAEAYGRDFVAHFGRRLGLDNANFTSIAFLISTTMNPWPTATPAGDFLAVVEEALRQAVWQAGRKLGFVAASAPPPARRPPVPPAPSAPGSTLGQCQTAAPYGSWRSPITADLIVQKSVRLREVRIDGVDTYWLEGRPDEKGRGVVVKLPAGAVAPIAVTPPFSEGGQVFDVGTQVYEYGGGAWVADEDRVYFCDMRTGRLYRQDGVGATPVPLTPDDRAGDRPARLYADGLIDRGRKLWIGVVEDWTRVDVTSGDPTRKYPRHRLAAVELAGGRFDPGKTIAEDHDFFSSPRLSPCGRALAWLAWNHPLMPWQGTTLYVAELDTAGMPTGQATAVAGGPAEAIYQPEWSPDGHDLWFVSDRSGWWNLYRYRREGGLTEAMLTEAAEFGEPQWSLGMSSYAFVTGGRVVAKYGRDGIEKLAVLGPSSGQRSDFELAFTALGSVRSDGADRVVFVGGGPRQPSSVVSLDVKSGRWEVLKQATTLADDPAIHRNFSAGTPLTFKTTDGEIAHGLFYPPANADYVGPEDEKPPLVVMCHGGPTGQSLPALKLGIQYWTSRGVAVLDVNYRGSSGYGRAYRDRLKESWGIVDVDDCINGARHLADQGLVDGDRTVITGGSAGGFTTLSALTFHDYFRAGASSYGIGNLETLAADTHKFESHYLDWLIGPYPEAIDRYRARSPIFHVEKLSCPVIFFQGELDQVVPPSQSETMFNAIKGKGLPVGYFLFAGERHGFRQDVNIRRAIEAEHQFFTYQVFRSKLAFPEAGRAPPAAGATPEARRLLSSTDAIVPEAAASRGPYDYSARRSNSG